MYSIAQEAIMTYPQLFFSKFTPIALVPTQSHRASLPTSESQSLPSINSSHSALLLLIILSGYTFGPWTDAIISYLAALTGALVLAENLLLQTSISASETVQSITAITSPFLSFLPRSVDFTCIYASHSLTFHSALSHSHHYQPAT